MDTNAKAKKHHKKGGTNFSYRLDETPGQRSNRIRKEEKIRLAEFAQVRKIREEFGPILTHIIQQTKMEGNANNRKRIVLEGFDQLPKNFQKEYVGALETQVEHHANKILPLIDALIEKYPHLKNDLFEGLKRSLKRIESKNVSNKIKGFLNKHGNVTVKEALANLEMPNLLKLFRQGQKNKNNNNNVFEA